MSKATGFRLDEDILPNLKNIAKEQERSYKIFIRKKKIITVNENRNNSKNRKHN